MSSKFLKGAFILTVGSMLSKVLGLFYLIPFEAMVGKTGGYLYNLGYVPYTLFISFATAGMPLAISKFVSKYNAIEEYAVSRRLFKSSLLLMMITGVLAFLFLYMLAPVYADFIKTPEAEVPVEDITSVIRAVSFALILVPFMSIIRGFFQGHEEMAPTAISQVVEQLVRIVFLLAGVFVVLKIADGSIVEAIQAATFAATIGALGGLLVLFWYWRKHKPGFDEMLARDRGTIHVSLPAIYKEILISSIPFVFVGIAMPVFQMVDNLTFLRGMSSGGLGKIAEDSLGILNTYAQKIVLIPMTLATGFSMALLPAITKAFVSEDFSVFKRYIDQAFQILLFITIPAVVGMAVLADPIYSSFYEHDPIGAEVLQAYAPTAVLFALFSVTASILQGINRQKFTVLSLLMGLLVKLSLNLPLIRFFGTDGSIYATSLGFFVACIMNLFVIAYFTGYRYNLVFKRTLLITIISIIMGIGTWIVKALLMLGLDTESRMEAVVITAIAAVFGAFIYAVITLKTKLAHHVLGSRIDRLRKKLKLSE
ncbi:putative polysaccharide biosynthesis protein [Bacillus massiliglaciei]|uniref:putative polysaccharide biosynthesis protein n=1 Tax=Bacillus massiliglaciei TaxID=1816693 RepID=UPI000A55807E|nr:polysaccharide biosynthesis protein [Bacillus massiliglaciei]